MSGGIKHDSNKPPLDLLTLEFLTGTANALAFGAAKYGRHNFKGGIDHSRLIAAALRHINQYNAGEDNDPESGESHLSHAAASLNMLMWMVANKPELDDRYKPEPVKVVSYLDACNAAAEYSKQFEDERKENLPVEEIARRLKERWGSLADSFSDKEKE